MKHTCHKHTNKEEQIRKKKKDNLHSQQEDTIITPSQLLKTKHLLVHFRLFIGAIHIAWPITQQNIFRKKQKQKGKPQNLMSEKENNK